MEVCLERDNLCETLKAAERALSKVYQFSATLVTSPLMFAAT